MNDAAAGPLPYARLSLFYFLYYAALGLFTPYFARWMQQVGLSPFAVSAIWSLWYATRIVAPSLWARWTSRSSDPQRWLHGGAFAATAGFALMLTASDWLQIAVAMAVFSFFYNAILPQFEALTLGLLGSRRGGYGRIRVWGSIGFLLVASASGPWLDQIGIEWLPAMMVMWVLASAFAVLPRFEHGRRDPVVATAGDLRAVLRSREVRAFLLLVLLWQTSFGAFYVFYTIHLGAAGHTGHAIGALWGLGVLAEILVFIVMPRVLARHSARNILLLSLGITALRWMIVAWVPESLPWMVLAQIAHALSFAAFYAASMQLLVGYFPGALAPQGQAILYGFSSGIGGVLGSLIAGLSWQAAGGFAAFAVAAAIAALALPLLLRIEPATTGQNRAD